MNILKPFVFFLLFLAWTSNSVIWAQNVADSLNLPEVTVTANYKDAEIRSSAPLQILTQDKLVKLNALQLSDAIKFFSGVTVKDYGGIGGLKTVSVRSLGANHTAVSYDGIRINDTQTGQIDVGRFSLDNVDVVSLSNGQSDNIFQPAQMFAAGAALNIRSVRPSFSGNRRTHGKISMKGGSFGLINPSARIARKINNKFSLSASGEFLTAEGKYPYRLSYGFIGIDSVSQETRQNTDVKNIRFETALFGQLSEKESIEASIYYYQSERGLPGATIFYNTQNFSSQRLWDKTFFLRSNYQKEFSNLWAIQANAKYNRGTLRYLDPTYLNENGKDESNYLQQEWYGSASVLYRAFQHISFSGSSDVSYTDLSADSYEFSYPSRITWLSVLAAKYVDNHLLATASVLSTMVNERVKTGVVAKNYRQLSPYMSLSFKPFENQELRLRAFYKHIFRMPTFNDLYYSRIGNPKLVPEKTDQFNIGLTYSTSVAKWFPALSLTIDAYHNNVKDKIVAYPTKNIFVWTMLNYGKVSIDGIDIAAETTFSLSKKIGLTLGYNHTYQKALDVTNPNDRGYRHQIPYTPRVSGSGRAALNTPWGQLAYTVIWSGHRYAGGQNYKINRLSGYAEHGISATKDFKIANNMLSATIEILNLGGENYEIVHNFPMPGRSVRATINYSF